MRIALLTTHLPPVMGGIEVHCLNLATALARHGHDVILYGSLEPDQDTKLTLQQADAGFIISRIPAWFAPGLKRPTRLWNLARAVRAEHERLPFDVLHAHQLYPVGVAGALLARRLRLPLVITEHGSILDDSRRPLRRLAMRWAGRVAGAVLTASEELAGVATGAGIASEKTWSVPNAIWPAQFESGPTREAAREQLGIPADRFVAAAVRRLVPKTGIQYAIRAAPECARAIPGYLLLIVGEGPMRGELERLADEVGAADQLSFVGGVPNERVGLYMRAADVGLFPSLAEATSIAALEFMASGTPVVASAVGGLPEIIDDGETGFLFDIGVPRSRYSDPGLPEAASRNLVRALERAAGADRRAMGAAAAAVVRERFSWPSYVRRLESEFYPRQRATYGPE